MVDEQESADLAEYVAAQGLPIATSRIALVEVSRATSVANPAEEVRIEAERLLASCLLIDVSDRVLRAASRLASRAVRTLDAIHLASARHVDADEMVVYDRRLLTAARAVGLAVAHPGMAG